LSGSRLVLAGAVTTAHASADPNRSRGFSTQDASAVSDLFLLIIR
jgi:hypothetical protein